VSFSSGLETTVTHGPDTLRITHPPNGPTSAARPQIWIFGCSFTHGWSLSDEQTYPWQVQRRIPEYEVVNFGVSGYGTVQSLIQFREALEQRSRSDVAIIAYASFHDERNTFSRDGLSTVDLSVDFADPANLNRPHSDHPGARATRLFAERLAGYLRAEVLPPS
jgi:hypothetical protein